MATKKLYESLAALDEARPSGTVRMCRALLDDWRKKRKWYKRAERRPWTSLRKNLAYANGTLGLGELVRSYWYQLALWLAQNEHWILA
jgi:hypothetical protein